MENHDTLSIQSSAILCPPGGTQHWSAASEVFPVLARMSLVECLAFRVLMQERGMPSPLSMKQG